MTRLVDFLGVAMLILITYIVFIYEEPDVVRQRVQCERENKVFEKRPNATPRSPFPFAKENYHYECIRSK